MEPSPTPRRLLVATMCAALIVALSMGARQALGIFLPPVTADLQMPRSSFSLALAIQNLVLGLPLLALLADRWGPRRILMLGGLLYAAGLALTSRADAASGLTLTLGPLVGLAQSGTAYVVTLGALARIVPPARRTRAFGIVTAAGSFGMFVVVQVAQLLIADLGWRTALLGLGGLVALIVLLALGLPNGARGGVGLPAAVRGPVPAAPPALGEEALGGVVRRALRHRGYWLLTAGFFVCGFQVAFIAAHLPACLADNAVSPTASATALGLIGLFNMAGSFGFGLLGDRLHKPYLLGAIYALRALLIAMFFLILPVTDTTALIFGAVIGLLWLGTVPLTSGMVAQLFGARYLSTLYGIVFLGHQLGSFLGVWLGGEVHDATHSYTAMWVAAVGLGLLAALVQLPIRARAAPLPPAGQPT